MHERRGGTGSAVVRAKTAVEPFPFEAADFAASSLARDWGI
jgi:hypothetical protein